jgi:ubiquinone/menaquinone biosynthesis C-methylase UbiE
MEILIDLGDLRHAVSTCKMLSNAVGTINQRPPGLHNDLIQHLKKLMSRLLAWYTRPRCESVVRSLDIIVSSFENLQTNLLAMDGRLNQLERDITALTPSVQTCMELSGKANQLWGERAQERQDQNMSILAWTDSSLVNQLYIHPTISGVAEDNWLTWVSKKYFPQAVHRALSIGCGDGCLERHALQLNIAQYFDAFDASPGAIEIARKVAKQTGIAHRVRYGVADLNYCHLEPQSYEAAFSSMALHHIRELEHTLEQILRSLKPGSLFILNEFVGPDQFQWTPTQVRIANELLQRIPERYRKSRRTGALKCEVSRPTRAEMTAGDPTKSIRSSEILPLVSQAFEIVQRVDYGGTIVNLVLEDIAGNFQWGSEDISILHMLFDAEKQLLRERVIPSDFTLVIARRPGQD